MKRGCDFSDLDVFKEVINLRFFFLKVILLCLMECLFSES